MIYRNIIKLDGSSDGISLNEDSCCISNSIWSNGGTGRGIYGTSTGRIHRLLLNNVVEGFSGTGGDGFDLTTLGNLVLRGGNAAFNNTTDYGAISDKIFFDFGDNETLSASPFTDAANGDFNPVDTGNIKEGSLPDPFNDS